MSSGEQNPGDPSLPPDSLIHDAHAQLSLIFQSSAVPHTGEVMYKSSVNDPTLILYCPVEGGESVIDATVKELALRTRALVKTIDIVQLINEQPRSFWKDNSKFGNNEQVKLGADSASSEEYGYFKLVQPITTAKIVELVDLAIQQPDNVLERGDNPDSNHRIIYIRDSGLLATFAPACYDSIIASVRKQSERSESDQTIKFPTAVILGTSPLLIAGSLFQNEESRQQGMHRSCPENARLPAVWGEGPDAQNSRDQRLREQHRMWNSETLTDHIHKHLNQAGVLTAADREETSSSKRLPTCIVVPTKRGLEPELLTRKRRRLELNRLGVHMALLAAGGELNTTDQLSAPGDTVDSFAELCKAKLIEYKEIERVAERAITTALAFSPDSGTSVPASISWDAYYTAWKDQEDRDLERASWLKSSIPTEEEEPKSEESSSSRGDSSPKEDDPEDKQDSTDLLIEKIKRDGDSYQRLLLDCLIRPADIQTGFDSVHLPDTTIDSIRTLVSLRLVCPEAFNTGILKQYGMSGALLFGPPGTGKTHLAKAIAKESGARMISIKPSDILDMYVGEDEKKIDALFKLARQLKPCIIFIDEVDALFGARMAARDNKSRWRTDMLTQFTQEMDGMRSSDVIVIGATNRPFDLDDAIIRRLPCRILVDLPHKDAREAILGILLQEEQLESDVSLTDLASLTPNFSGSDLKHLCVSAAFESAKEVAKVSWAEKKGGKSSPTVSSLGVSTPVASDLGTDSPPNGDLVEGPMKPSSMPMPDDGNTQSDPPSQIRKLAKKHFTQALKQVRASTSETQTSLVELRRWNDQFGSGNQSTRAVGSGVVGMNLPGSNRPWMNGSGMAASGIGATGMHASVMNGMGNRMSGFNMPGMGMPGGGASGTGPSGGNSHGSSFTSPVEGPGTYSRSLGIQR